ncbi:MAG: hypothetical protein KGH63_00700 [Candidatus Micrarchaeota archaeon]|nr:hypothetical protein [Candidatus Micrarchaeota archaeon]
MYHPGKIVEVLRPSDKEVQSADSSVQATLRMWDENIITLIVAPKLAAKVKAGQMVLVDYRPSPEHRPPTPAHIIVKILSGKKAEAVWSTYREMYDRQKRQSAPAAPAQSYIG